MKNLNCFKVIIGGMFLALIFCSSNAFSQGTNWRLNGNSNVGQDDFIGTKNDADFVIRTNNRERIRVTTDNYTIFEDSVRIKGPLHIGDSSLVVGQINGFPGDNIQSSAGHVNFGNTVMFNFSNIKIGIGLTAPQHKLHINDRNQFIFGQPNPVFSAYTNQSFGSGTGIAATDGFLVGIAADGTAELRQQENRAIRIFTNDGMLNNQRMIITHSDDVANLPRVGIGREDLLNPRTFLHIGQDIDFSGFGYRDWMNVGELVVDEKGSNMYFGFSTTTGHIINWGNRSTNTINNTIRFVNTSGNSTVPSGTPDGLEVARMVVSEEGSVGRMGIGDFYNLGEDPTQTLDVDGNARLRDLPVNFHDETLTRCVVVDDDGVLHWRNFTGGGPGTSLGNDCELDPGDPGFNPLPIDTDWEIPLNDNNFVFSGQGIGNNRVGIGIADCQPTAKLDVFMDPGEINSISIKGVNEGFLAPSGVSIGIYGDASNSQNSIGICGVASNSHICTGVLGTAQSSTSSKNNGGFFTADNATYNYAGYFEALSSNPNSINNYGVYAVCPPIVTGADGNWAGYFIGDVHVVGNITSTETISDQQFKQNIVNYNGALDIIRDLRPVNFYFDTVNYDLNFPTCMQYGLIAQEVETILPELVRDEIIPAKFDTAGNIISESIPYKGLNYQQLTPIILQAVRELDETITGFMQTTEDPQLKGSVEDLQYINDSLTQRVNSLEARLENIEQMLFYNSDVQINNTKETSFQQEVTLENTKSIVLNQNVPNPFKEQTTISFQIPATVSSAKIVFIDNLGNILKEVEINERGYGELIVYAHDLSAGHYTYYLVADGNTIESKKMVLTK